MALRAPAESCASPQASPKNGKTQASMMQITHEEAMVKWPDCFEYQCPPTVTLNANHDSNAVSVLICKKCKSVKTTFLLASLKRHVVRCFPETVRDTSRPSPLSLTSVSPSSAPSSQPQNTSQQSQLLTKIVLPNLILDSCCFAGWDRILMALSPWLTAQPAPLSLRLYTNANITERFFSEFFLSM
mmetsp:Transcript_53633/g.61549  ORF Transcript_53633/g.61549 Transcript_53633/m.61549 type:complete len:186 (+) Transcript_53633:331-888(+)